MLSALVRIFLGVDVALGLFNYAAWSWLAGQPCNVWFLWLSLFSTHLPDVDMIPYLIFRKRYGLTSHRIFAHHPLLVLPLTAIVSFYIAKTHAVQAGFIVGLVTTGVLLHFLHDGMGMLGFPWLSPFSMTHFRFRNGKFSVVPPEVIEYWKKRVKRWKQKDPSAADEITTRVPRMTRAQALFWGAGLVVVIVFIAAHHKFQG